MDFLCLSFQFFYGVQATPFFANVNIVDPNALEKKNSGLYIQILTLDNGAKSTASIEDV